MAVRGNNPTIRRSRSGEAKVHTRKGNIKVLLCGVASDPHQERKYTNATNGDN